MEVQKNATVPYIAPDGRKCEIVARRVTEYEGVTPPRPSKIGILTRGDWLRAHASRGAVIADTRGRKAVVVGHRDRKQVVAVGGSHLWWETDYLGREWRSATRSVDGVCDETYEIVGNIYDMEKL